METIEFQAQAKNGFIKIPQKYKSIGNALLKIKIVHEKKLSNNQNKLKIKKLLQQIKTKDIFKNIKDPNAWQRELRNEWEKSAS